MCLPLALLISAALPPHSAADFVSPPIDWLHDRRVVWPLKRAGLMLEPIEVGLQGPYMMRYLEFRLSKPVGGRRVTYEVGEMNFWTTKRLVETQVLTARQAASLSSGHRVYPADQAFECVIHDKFSGRNVFMRVFHPQHSVKELKALTETLSLTGP